ncbi:hypothetical protein [Mucilaginibacter sp.]|uniref:hypothetical protein n=1 Tax=Mucilaginibacter sp. TaxID=1882438 RepID=UPI0035BC94AE
MTVKDLKILDDLQQRTANLPDILHLRAAEFGYQLTDEDKALLLDTYSKLDDILKEVAAFINIKFPKCERHVRAWNEIDFDTKIGDFKIITNDREHIKREWRKGMFDLKSLIKVLINETVLVVEEKEEQESPNNVLKDISSDRPLSHFTNEEVIPNQKLVNETISFFESGQGKGLFTPLEILNLIDKQKNFVMLNYNNGDIVMQHFQGLPLSGRATHSLYGFILKWFGGYPVNNMNEELNATLKLIQSEFLSFNGDTPEKQYCKVDQKMRNKFERYGIAFTTAINHGIDVSEVLSAMETDEPEDVVFHNFEDLFAAAIKDGVIETYTNKKDYLIAQGAFNYQFNVWLQEHKNWEYRNEEQYQMFLNKDVFTEFLAFKTKKAATSTPAKYIPDTTAAQINTPHLTIKQVALICHYTDCMVTRSNANSIIEKYGHTSGDRLFNTFSHYRSKANRVGAENTKKKNKNKLDLFESVHIYLISDETAKPKIEADLASLRTAIEQADSTL